MRKTKVKEKIMGFTVCDKTGEVIAELDIDPVEVIIMNDTRVSLNARIFVWDGASSYNEIFREQFLYVDNEFNYLPLKKR